MRRNERKTSKGEEWGEEDVIVRYEIFRCGVSDRKEDRKPEGQLTAKAGNSEGS